MIEDLPVSLRYLLAFGLPFLGALAITPSVGRWATKMGIVNHPSADRFHRQTTPYLGGAAVGAAFLAAAVFIAGTSTELVVVLLAASAICVVGLVDDRRTVRPSIKLVVECSAALSLWMVGIRAEIFGIEAIDLVLTILWVVAVTNAFNLLDNMDGLATGVAAISAATFFGIAAYHGDFVVASFCLALVGASLGFLRHNFPPAKIFLGDAGALLIGFLIASFGLETQVVGERGLIWISVPLFAVAVPLIDTTYVVISRIRGGRPIYVGGTDHTSHRLVALGLSPTATAAVNFTAQGTFAGLALWTALDGSLAPLVASPFVIGTVAMGLWALVIQPRSLARAETVIELDVIALDMIELPAGTAPAAAQPVFFDAKRRA